MKKRTNQRKQMSEMSAAFNTIDHELLLKTLKNSYGIDKYLCTMLRNKVAECINEMKEWFSTNYLKLNEDKAKLVLFSKPSVFKNNCFTIATKKGKIKEKNGQALVK